MNNQSHSRKLLLSLALVSAGMLGTGCSVGDANDANAVLDTASASGPLTEVTAVELLADGSSHVVTTTLTAAELADEVRAQETLLTTRATIDAAGGEHVGEAEEAITRDTLCGGASVWLYNVHASGCESPGGAPDGAKILCFKGAGTVNLHDYSWFENLCLPVGSPTCTPTLVKRTWDYQVKRYWPGVDAGSFYDASCVGWWCLAEHFNASQACTTAGSVAQESNRLCLGPGC
jgi:hypothetical protein